MKMQCLRILFDAHKFRVHSQIRESRLFPVSPILADLVYLYPVVLTGKSKEMIGI